MKNNKSMNKTWYKRGGEQYIENKSQEVYNIEKPDEPITQLSPEEWLHRIKEWMGELFGMDKTAFLQYLTASPEIKKNEEVREYIKECVFNYVTNYKSIQGIINPQVTNNTLLIKLLYEFRDDFLISSILDEIEDAYKVNKGAKTFKVGDRVIIDGGAYSSQKGTVTYSDIPNEDNKPINWSKEVTIKLDNGKIITMPKNYIKKI